MPNSELKTDALRQCRSILAELPFSTIYSYADILFDRKEARYGDPSLAPQINFLKTTRLEDISYAKIDKQPFFEIVNRGTKQAIALSNRLPTRGELRGERLREYLDNEKKINPNATLYDAITKAIRNPAYSDMILMLKATVANGVMTAHHYGTCMSFDHFELLIEVLLTRINEKIHSTILSRDFEPQEVRNDVMLQNQIWKGIDLDALYDSTEQYQAINNINKLINKIRNKSDNLQARGFSSAATQALSLAKSVQANINRLLDKKITTQQFKEECMNAMTKAQQSELKNHRSFLGIIVHQITLALNILTCGAIAVAHTQSLGMIFSTQKELASLPDTLNMPLNAS